MYIKYFKRFPINLILNISVKIISFFSQKNSFIHSKLIVQTKNHLKLSLRNTSKMLEPEIFTVDMEIAASHQKEIMEFINENYLLTKKDVSPG